MDGVNTRRLLLSGLAAGVVIWLLEGAMSVTYMDDMERVLESHNLAMTLGVTGYAISVVVSLLVGLVLMFFYAASRTRLGAGPRTAVVVAAMLWLGGYVPSLLGFMMLGLFETSMLLLWGVVGLVELIVAALIGGWLYQE